MSDVTCVKIPYSRGYVDFNLKTERIKGILTPGLRGHAHSCLPQEEIVKKALENPINSPRLCELAENSRKVLVVTSDHTRPVPSRITMPLLLDEIRRMNKNVEIKILIATGLHRSSTHEEIEEKFGRELSAKETIINHNPRDSKNLVFKGVLPSGAELWLNRLVDWADLLVSEGFIEPHFFAGFSGGRKSILPGIAGEKTILANHCSGFIENEFSRTGNIEGNPIHGDMMFAARSANLKFILNVALDAEKQIVGAFAGHPEDAYMKGCGFVNETARVKAVKADIVITSNGGYPLDQNIYQTVKGMTAAEACVNEGGVIIMVAGCIDGHGGEKFYQWFRNASSPHEVAREIANIPRDETMPDQWQAQILARVLMKSNVIILTDLCDPKLIEDMHMTHAFSIHEAIKKAEEKAGKDAGIVVIPDGVSVIMVS